MDIISDLNSEIALAVLMEKQHRRKLDGHEVAKVLGRVATALEPLTHSSEHPRRGDAGGSEKIIINSPSNT